MRVILRFVDCEMVRGISWILALSIYTRTYVRPAHAPIAEAPPPPRTERTGIDQPCCEVMDCVGRQAHPVFVVTLVTIVHHHILELVLRLVLRLVVSELLGLVVRLRINMLSLVRGETFITLSTHPDIS